MSNSTLIYNLLPEEQDRHKLIMMMSHYPRIPDKWTASALAYIHVKAGVKFNRYWQQSFKFLLDRPVIYQSNLLGDLNLLLVDRIVLELDDCSVLDTRCPIVKKVIKKGKELFLNDYVTIKKIKFLMLRHGIPIDRSELYIFSRLLHKPDEKDQIIDVAKYFGLSEKNLENYFLAIQEL